MLFRAAGPTGSGWSVLDGGLRWRTETGSGVVARPRHAQPGAHIDHRPRRDIGILVGFNELVPSHYCGSLAKYDAAFYKR